MSVPHHVPCRPHVCPTPDPEGPCLSALSRLHPLLASPL